MQSTRPVQPRPFSMSLERSATLSLWESTCSSRCRLMKWRPIRRWATTAQITSLQTSLMWSRMRACSHNIWQPLMAFSRQGTSPRSASPTLSLGRHNSRLWSTYATPTGLPSSSTWSITMPAGLRLTANSMMGASTTGTARSTTATTTTASTLRIRTGVRADSHLLSGIMMFVNSSSITPVTTSMNFTPMGSVMTKSAISSP